MVQSPLQHIEGQFVLGRAYLVFSMLPRHICLILVINSMANGKFNDATVGIIEYRYTDSFQICFKNVIKQNEYTVNPFTVICVMLHRIVYAIITFSKACMYAWLVAHKDAAFRLLKI